MAESKENYMPVRQSLDSEYSDPNAIVNSANIFQSLKKSQKTTTSLLISSGLCVILLTIIIAEGVFILHLKGAQEEVSASKRSPRQHEFCY